MVKTIQLSEENYAKLFELKNQKIQELAKNGKFENPGFNEIITELIKKNEV